MSKGSQTQTDLLALAFNGTLPTWWANTHFYVALHTADPSSGAQNTNETTYRGYQRAAVARQPSAFPVGDGRAQNAATIRFPKCADPKGEHKITHVSIGTAATGAGQIVYAGKLSRTLKVSDLIEPQFEPQSLGIAEV